jgi:hypothetical protein
MATAQQERKFTDEGAERFAALMAGFDVNPSEPEAMNKGRLLRRMAAERNVRLVDAFELPEIRAALDAQMKPERVETPDVAAMETELEDLRGKLGLTVPKVKQLVEMVEAVTRERDDNAHFYAQCVSWFFGIVTFLNAGLAILAIMRGDWWVVLCSGAGTAIGLWFLRSEI